MSDELEMQQKVKLKTMCSFLIFLQILNAKVRKAEEMQPVRVQYKNANIGVLCSKARFKKNKNNNFVEFCEFKAVMFVLHFSLFALFPFKSHKLHSCSPRHTHTFCNV